MKIVPLAQDVPLNDFEGKAENSRPPDAAIRANAAIMQACMESTGRLMQAAGRGGLNIVVSGSNATAPRAPERISGFNGNELAAIGALGGLAAKSAGAEKEQPKVDKPASNPPPPNPPTPEPKADVKPSNTAPAPTVSEQPATPVDKKETAPPTPKDKQGHKKKPAPEPKPKPGPSEKEEARVPVGDDALNVMIYDTNGDGSVDDHDIVVGVSP